MVNRLRGSSDFDNECIVQQFHGFLRIIKYKFMMWWQMYVSRKWRFLTLFFYLPITETCPWDHSVKFSSHYPSSKTIKNPPVLQVSRWSLGGHGGS